MTEDQDETFLEKVGNVYELTEVGNILEDDDVKWTLEKLTKLIAKPDVPARTAVPLMLKLQAMSFKFKMQAKFYMHSGKVMGIKDYTTKKNYYMTLAEETRELVSVLKYITKAY